MRSGKHGRALRKAEIGRRGGREGGREGGRKGGGIKKYRHQKVQTSFVCVPAA